MALTTKQRGVLAGMAGGATFTVVAITAAILAGPILLLPESSFGDRIAFALKVDIVVALWLSISVGRLASHRFFTPEDIDGGGLSGGTQQARVLQATLQNTVEQTVLAVLAHTIWAVLMPLTWLAAIPAAAAMFVCGRILFVRGYARGAPARALGFTLTFYPSVLMILIMLVSLGLRGV